MGNAITNGVENGHRAVPLDAVNPVSLQSMATPDEILLPRIVQQDATAFAEFYDRHSPRVFQLLVRWLGNASHAEDVLQDAFWQIWDRAESYDSDRGSVVAWLVLIARSRATDYARRVRVRATMALGEGVEPGVTIANDRIEHIETRERLQEALARLPDEQQRVIKLAFYDGLTHEQIASTQDVALGTVKTRIRLGVRKLREILRAEQKALAS